jgi:hypothetical protein
VEKAGSHAEPAQPVNTQQKAQHHAAMHQDTPITLQLGPPQAHTAAAAAAAALRDAGPSTLGAWRPHSHISWPQRSRARTVHNPPADKREEQRGPCQPAARGDTPCKCHPAQTSYQPQPPCASVQGFTCARIYMCKEIAPPPCTATQGDGVQACISTSTEIQLSTHWPYASRMQKQ